MKPSVTSLAAPNHPATHPPTQPDEPIEKKSPGTEARGFSTRGLFSRLENPHPERRAFFIRGARDPRIARNVDGVFTRFWQTC
jgi:hypothetical protein